MPIFNTNKNKDDFYFDNFVECTRCSLRAALLLEETMKDFSPAKLEENVDRMHEIEHEADTKKHEVLAVLMKAFMTPIDGEDISLLSSCLDEVSDKIEDVIQRMYCNYIHDILPSSLEIVAVVVESCREMVTLLEEFKNFKRSKTIHEHIIRINTLEEDADRLFIKAMRNLHEDEDDPVNMLKWREILMYLEKCTDATEHVADVVERVIMTNT